MKLAAVDLSVVVPTYRPEDIRPLLTGLVNQKDKNFELIIVENGSDKKVLPELLAEFEFLTPPIYVHEISPGLNRARNIGVQASSTSHIALIDDDCIPNNDWVAEIKRAHKMFPNAGVIGGKVLLKHKGVLPFWLNLEMRNSLSELDYGEQLKPLERWQYLVGANLSFSRMIFDDMAGFNEALGLNGEDCIKRVNDEIEFVLKASLSGCPGAVYTGEAVVMHAIPPERVSFDYLLRRWFGQGVSDIESDLLLGGVEKAIRSFYTIAFQSQWHLKMLKDLTVDMSVDNINEFLWKGMLIRAIYLYGLRERLMSQNPEYGVISVLGSFESGAFSRGQRLMKTHKEKEAAELRNCLLQSSLYKSENSISPFTRILFTLGMANHELKLKLKLLRNETP